MRDDDIVPALDRYLATFQRATRFGYDQGGVDCIRLTSPWVHLRTGIDPLAGIAPWDDEMSAMRRLLAMGVRDVAELADRFLDRRSLLTARVGDIVSAQAREHPMLGISLGARVLFITPDRGFQRMQLVHCAMAWSVD